MPNAATTFDFEVATVPESEVQQSVGLECCEEYRFLGSTTDASSEFNDSFLAVGKKASVSDDFEFVIKKCGESVALPNLGSVIDFPQDSLAYAVLYDLRQYLSPPYGAGYYNIFKEYTFLGATKTELYAKIRIWEFTDDKANRTFKVRSGFDNLSKVGSSFIDFTGSNAYSDLRLNGKFGTWKAQTKTRTLVDQAYKANITASNNDNNFLLEVYPLSYLLSNRLINLHLLCGVEHFFTDHNNNHRKYTNYHVEYLTETLNQEEPSVEQIITAEFVDFTKDKITRYNKK